MDLWIEHADATTYFETRLGADAWTAATTDQKTAALTTAQRDLLGCPEFTFDLEEDPTEDQQYAVCEQALFLLGDPDMGRRQSLIAQGVKEAGMIKEVYTGAVADVLIAPRAKALLVAGGFSTGESSSFRVER